MIAFGPAGFAILGFIGIIGGLSGTYFVHLITRRKDRNTPKR